MPVTEELVPYAVKTYRYLRLAIVVVVLAAVASVLIERSHTDCWQASISAYYYTPVHAMFVGALVAIGVCLIAVKGSEEWEDMLLNVAGATVGSRADAGSQLFLAEHAVAARVVGVEAPAEDVAVELLQLLAVLAHHLDVDDLVGHRCIAPSTVCVGAIGRRYPCDERTGPISTPPPARRVPVAEGARSVSDGAG